MGKEGVNPYWGVDFFEFIALFLSRFFKVITGQVPMVSDELQIFTLGILGISTALIGAFLVLRRSCMQANALSHTTLLGIVLTVIILSRYGGLSLSGGIVLDLPRLFIASILTALITALLTHLFLRKFNLQEDASIGLVFTMLFALGILMVTLFSRNLHIGVEAIMGNVDAIHKNDLNLALFVLAFNLTFMGVLYHWYKISTFDFFFAKSLGIRVGWIDLILLFQTTLTIMAGFRAVGVILVLSFLTAPILSARFFVVRLHTLCLSASLITLICSFFSVALSRHLLSVNKIPLSTSGINIVFLLIFFILCVIFVFSKRKVVFRKNDVATSE
ncbi:MAG: metal ABC transporter permease [Simkaniaceae bacterium]|nr:metal ABC transporter permease [Simkaniaceae bacterium]MCF7852435.1 metal ABC transporter permease [Simkaniaceae bacterium]